MTTQTMNIDFQTFIDVESGRKYFFNPSTGKCAWDPAELQSTKSKTVAPQTFTTSRSPSSTSKPDSRSTHVPHPTSPRRIPAKAMARASRTCSIVDGPPTEIWAARSRTNTEHSRRQSQLLLGLQTVVLETPIEQRFRDPVSGHEYVVDSISGQTRWVCGSQESHTKGLKSSGTQGKNTSSLRIDVRSRARTSSSGSTSAYSATTPRLSARARARASHNVAANRQGASSGGGQFPRSPRLAEESEIHVFRVLRDETSGTDYYQSYETGSTMWELPAMGSTNNTVWLAFEAESDSGQRYFQKQGSDVTTWEIPGWTDPLALTATHSVHAKIDAAIMFPQSPKAKKGCASTIVPTARPGISNPFILREHMCSAVIAGAASDLEELLLRSKVESHSAFGNALEAALSLAERYDQIECGQVISTALSEFHSDRRKSATILAAAQAQKYATVVVQVEDVELVERAKAYSHHESKVQEVISAALNSPQDLEQLERALDLGNQIIRNRSATQVSSTMLQGLKQLRTHLSEPEGQHQQSTRTHIHRTPTSAADLVVQGAGLEGANGAYFASGTRQGVESFTNEEGYMVYRALVGLGDETVSDSTENAKIDNSISLKDTEPTCQRQRTVVRRATLARTRSSTAYQKAHPNHEPGHGETTDAHHRENKCMAWIVRAPGKGGAVDAGRGDLLYGVVAMDRRPPMSGWEVYENEGQGGKEPAPTVVVGC